MYFNKGLLDPKKKKKKKSCSQITPSWKRPIASAVTAGVVNNLGGGGGGGAYSCVKFNSSSTQINTFFRRIFTILGKNRNV